MLPDLGLALPGRVLMTADAVGGVWRYAVEISRGLAGRGCQVVLAVLGPAPNPAQRAEIAGIPGVRLIATGLQLDWLAEQPDDLRQLVGGLVRFAADADVALLHAPSLAALGEWPVPVAVVAHSCVATWWDAVRGGEVPADYAWRAQATKDGLHRADAVAAPSHAFADALHRLHGVTEITMVHNGRDPVPLPDVPRSRAALTAGRLWDDGKNAALLDAIAARLSVPLYAAGPTNGPGGAAIQIRHMVLLGQLDEAALGRAFARATVFASAARYEPFGLAVLEAAQSGLALVLSDIPTFRELWEGAAVFVAPDDAEGWLAALEQMLDAPEPWAARARQRAARYTAAAMVDGTAALLARAMA